MGEVDLVEDSKFCTLKPGKVAWSNKLSLVSQTHVDETELRL